MTPIFHPAPILLPKKGLDLTKWSCIACDQFTSQPSYWEEAAALVGDSPSALRLILPECYLKEEDRLIESIHAAMKRYLSENLLSSPGEGYILTARTTAHGTRLGLVGMIDLEDYDYSPESKSPIRASEETIRSRIPARMKIRRGAELELPHVLLLMNDPSCKLLTELYEKRPDPLYDFELMLGGGHLCGYGFFLDAEKAFVQAKLSELKAQDGLSFVVGDGNHSLASAKAYWEEVKAGLSPEEAACHPARYALTELVNIHDPALIFAPIHRVLFDVKPEEVLNDLKRALNVCDHAVPSCAEPPCVAASCAESYCTKTSCAKSCFSEPSRNKPPCAEPSCTESFCNEFSCAESSRNEPSCAEPSCTESFCNEFSCVESSCAELSCAEPSCTESFCNESSCAEPSCTKTSAPKSVTAVWQGQSEQIALPEGELEIAVLQRLLDGWLKAHPEAGIDYVHGEESVCELSEKPDTLGFLLPTPDRSGLFESVARGGSLPRKTFSMGIATEKRYYLEARKLVR